MNNDQRAPRALDAWLRPVRLDVEASPMLGLVEVRARRDAGELETIFLDSADAARLAEALWRGALDLRAEEDRRHGGGPRQRFEVVRRFGAEGERGWVVFDHVRWGVLSAFFAEGEEEDAARWAGRLNASDELWAGGRGAAPAGGG